MQKDLFGKPVKEKFIGLEWLRFFLGIFIVMYHTLHTYSDYTKFTHYISDLGFVATSCFFILSGFLLTHVYLDWNKKNITIREPAKHFWIKRFSNLYPIHIGSLIFFIAVVLLINQMGILSYDAEYSLRNVTFDVNKPIDHSLITHQMSYLETGFVFVLNLFLLQSWNPYYLSFNLPAWSISTLFFFYFTFPYIAPRLAKIKKPFMAIVINNITYLIPVTLVILFTAHDMPETGMLHRNPLFRLPEFILGILLCVIYHRRKDSHKTTPNYISYLFILVFAISMVFATMILKELGNVGYYLLHNGLLMIPEGLMIYAFAVLKFDYGTKINKFATTLGGSSLPMFALHIPIFMLFVRFERILVGDPLSCFQSWQSCVETAGDKSIVFYPLYMLLTIIVCIYFQKYFVVYFREKIKSKMIH